MTEAKAQAKFRRAGRKVRCRMCLGKAAAHSHHVVHEQILRWRGLPQWDLRNLMALCANCHFSHHESSGNHKIPLALLTDENIAYAIEVFGDAVIASQWLRKNYSGDDTRI